jgi:D-arabinose 1-dehydrogenase-like Zn-dependent alcohol dehydrogenase
MRLDRDEMRAVVLTTPGGGDVLHLVGREKPRVGAGDVLLKVAACGVCGQDRAVREGLIKVDLPCVIGHEISGVVEEVGASVDGFRPGDRVACKQFSTCGHCRACRSGRDTDCAYRKHVYGGYAEYVAIPQDALLAVPDGVGLIEASIVSCAVGSVLQALTEVAQIRGGEYVAVTGAGGGLGVHAIQIAAAFHARPIALTTSPAKADLLRTLGACAVLDPSSEDFGAALADTTEGQGPHVVLDNVGNAATFLACFRALRQHGRYVFTGQIFKERISLYPAFIFQKEAVITGSASTRMGSFMAAMELVERKTIRPVVTPLPLDQAGDLHQAKANTEFCGRAVLVASPGV